MEGVSDEQKPEPQPDQLGMEERRSRLVEAGRSRIMSPATAFSIDSLLKPELRTNSLSFPSSRVKPEYHHHHQRSIKPELEASLQEAIKSEAFGLPNPEAVRMDGFGGRGYVGRREGDGGEEDGELQQGTEPEDQQQDCNDDAGTR